MEETVTFSPRFRQGDARAPRRSRAARYMLVLYRRKISEGSSHMMVIRSFLILMSVFLLASIEQASAHATAIHPAAISQPGPILAGDVLCGGRCPRLCVEWFDGCNNCSCGKGRINACTEFVCRWHKRPRCLRWGF
jgi:hypothetical protein